MISCPKCHLISVEFLSKLKSPTVTDRPSPPTDPPTPTRVNLAHRTLNVSDLDSSDGEESNDSGTGSDEECRSDSDGDSDSGSNRTRSYDGTIGTVTFSTS